MSNISCYLTIAPACSGVGEEWLNGKVISDGARDRWDGEFVCGECCAKLLAENDEIVRQFVEEECSEAHEGSAGTAPLPGTHAPWVNTDEVQFYGIELVA